MVREKCYNLKEQSVIYVLIASIQLFQVVRGQTLLQPVSVVFLNVCCWTTVAV